MSDLVAKAERILELEEDGQPDDTEEWVDLGKIMEWSRDIARAYLVLRTTAKSDALKPRKAREWWLDPDTEGQVTIIAYNVRHDGWVKVREVLDDGVDPQENMR